MIDEFVHPESHEALAMESVKRAFWLDQSRFALKYEAIHGAPEGLTPEQIAQRNALLNLSEQIITKARDREMEKAVEQWNSYRTWRRG